MARLQGGEFILRNIHFNEAFIPEEWNEEQTMIATSCEQFIDHSIRPNLDAIDHQQEGLMVKLLEEAGALGLLSLSIPENFGGMGVDMCTSLLATEHLGKGHSFSVAFGAHTGIGTLPLLYYGTTEQHNRYLPKLATGEWKAAYCLTEPNSGSDANSGKTQAKLNATGTHYVLNGQKMWITNGGFANLYTVFAKIDDDTNLSAFLVEANSPGVSLNPEEHKMGIKGSSTRQIFFNDVLVPVENLLSGRQEGFKIALNILNIGRIKLAAGVLGGSKDALGIGVNYAIDRNQFGQSISNYGAIQAKIGEQVIRTYVLESALYRVGQDIDSATKAFEAEGLSKSAATLKGVEEYAAECALLKVAGSECLDFVVDEALQIHGGMGYSAESAIERAYRDSRINRIFEGTNEINRMLLVDMVLRSAMKGKLDLLGPAKKIAGELMSIPSFEEISQSPLAAQRQAVEQFKKVILMIMGAAVQKLGKELSKEQELLMNVADIAIWTYQAESALLRVEKLISTNGEAKCTIEKAIVETYVYDCSDRITKAGKDAILSFSSDDEARMMLMGLKRFAKAPNVNSLKNRRSIAEQAITKKGMI